MTKTQEERETLYIRIQGLKDWRTSYVTSKFNEMEAGVITKEEYQKEVKETDEYTEELIGRMTADLFN